MPKRTKLSENVECPQCHKEDRPILLDRLSAVQHIPARYVLECAHCQNIFYKKAPENGENEIREADQARENP